MFMARSLIAITFFASVLLFGCNSGPTVPPPAPQQTVAQASNNVKAGLDKSNLTPEQKAIVMQQVQRDLSSTAARMGMSARK